jgi:hypothetical protein
MLEPLLIFALITGTPGTSTGYVSKYFKPEPIFEICPSCYFKKIPVKDPPILKSQGRVLQRGNNEDAIKRQMPSYISY